MSEDEAFIRAIVDSPGDDTPRLVYADWLDDRDDPRGPYLRVEREWASSGRKEKALRARAAPLDPVWVARVSRPPVGICVDQVRMRTGHKPLAPGDLEAAEGRLKVTLPAEYRALLLNWNGAAPAVNWPPQPPRFRYGLSEVARFFHLVPASQKSRSDSWDLVGAVELLCDPDYMLGYDANAMGDYIPIGSGGGEGDYYCLGVSGKVIGRVAFYHDFTHNAGDPSHLGVVARSLGAFLRSIVENAPAWYRYAQNGDRPALLRWLEAGGNVNARNAERGESLLSLAVAQTDLATVRELLARGAKVDRRTRESAGYLTGSTGRKIRDALAAAPVTKAVPRKGKAP